MKYDAERIKALNPLSRELDRYGIVTDKKGFARCPFHNEKTASFRVYEDGTFHCFGCHAYGDVITFIRLMENLSFNDACARLDRDISYAEQRKIERSKRRRESEKTAREQAEEFGHSFERETAYLCVHSMLHLLGYDHERSDEEDIEMRSKQSEIMKIMGLEVK